jgi:hypothetical protein
MKPGKVSFESVYRSVKEYRDDYPEKAVIYSGRLSDELNWAVFMAGGSMANVPQLENSHVMKLAGRMKPFTGKEKSKNQWILSDEDNYLVYTLNTDSIKLDFINDPGIYQFTWIDPADGKTIVVETREIKSSVSDLKTLLNGKALLWIANINRYKR